MKSFVALAMATTAIATAIPADAVEKRADTICLNFQSTLDEYYVTLNGGWGSQSQGLGAIGGICVPLGTNGAAFIGPDANPGPGSTKLECYFDDAGAGNCDVSLVDGYSLTVACYENTDGTDGPVIGGTVDLATTGIACPDQVGPNCINQNGGSASSQSQINAYFQPATENGNNYCIWHDCSQVNYPVSDANNFRCYIS